VVLKYFLGGVKVGVQGEWITKIRYCAVPFNKKGEGNQILNASLFNNETNQIIGIYKLPERYICLIFRMSYLLKQKTSTLYNSVAVLLYLHLIFN
jgi:hypothetical protein